MTITVTPKSASTINLDEVIIQISNGTKLCILAWNTSKFALQPSSSGVFSTPGLFDLEASSFGIIVEEDGDGSCNASNPIINKGDKACITVNLSACFNGLDSRADVRGIVIPEVGAPAVIFFRTPATNSNMVVDFF